MPHVNLTKNHPAAYQQVVDLDSQLSEAVKAAGLDPKLAELVKIRV